MGYRRFQRHELGISQHADYPNKIVRIVIFINAVFLTLVFCFSLSFLRFWRVRHLLRSPVWQSRWSCWLSRPALSPMTRERRQHLRRKLPGWWRLTTTKTLEGG